MEGPVLEEAQLFSGPTSPLGSPGELSKMLMPGSPPRGSVGQSGLGIGIFNFLVFQICFQALQSPEVEKRGEVRGLVGDGLPGPLTPQAWGVLWPAGAGTEDGESSRRHRLSLSH